jgi:hypothetical protein
MSSFGGTLWGGSLWGGSTTGGGGVPGVAVGQGLLYPALRKAGITLGPGRTPSAAQFQDSIDELNRLTDSLNIDRLFIYSRDTYLAPLNGQKSYVIGISSDPAVLPDINLPRPAWIESANIVSGIAPPAPIRYPLAIIDDLRWAKIRFQDIPNTVAEALYYDHGYPFGTIYLWGQPIAGYLLELFVWHQIPQFVNLTDQVYLPPGYADALVLNLAVRLAPHFQKVLDQNVREDARISLMRLESINAPQPIADLSGGLGRGCNRYNVYSDQIK